MTRTLASIAAAALAANAAAGPWGQDRGGVYAEMSAGYLATETLATPDGHETDIPEYEKAELVLYAEIGVAHRVTALVSAPVWYRASIDGFDEAANVGDLRAGVQVLLASPGEWRLAARGVVQAPTGDEAAGGGLLASGSGVWEADGVLSAGRSFADGSAFGFLEVGYRLRTEELQDAVVYAGQLGFRAGDRTTLTLDVSGVEPIGDRSGEPASSPSGLGDGTQYLAYGAGVAVRIAGPWSLRAALEDTTHAANLATGLTARLGVSFKR